MKARLERLLQRWRRQSRRLAREGRITESRQILDCECDVRECLRTATGGAAAPPYRRKVKP